MSEKIDGELFQIIHSNVVSTCNKRNEQIEEALEILGADHIIDEIMVHRIKEFVEKKGLLLIKNPDWKFVHFRCFVPIKQRIVEKKHFLRETEREIIVEKCLLLADISNQNVNKEWKTTVDYKKIPQKVLLRAAEVVKNSNGLITHVRVAYITDKSFSYVPSKDPILLGFCARGIEEQATDDYRISQCAFAIVLGMWGEDLEEIDLTLFKK